MSSLKIFPCGLATNPLLFGSKKCSAVIGGYYNGKTLDRYMSIDLCSIVHLFEASRLQKGRLNEKFFQHQRVRVAMGALTKTDSIAPLTFNDYSRKTNLHKGKYGYGALKEHSSESDTDYEYTVQPINLRYYLDLQLNQFQNHIHLDIEGAEIEVLNTFGKELKNYTHQVSLELERKESTSLLQEYRRLAQTTNNEFGIFLINPNATELLPFKEYRDVLSRKDIRSINVYMINLDLLIYAKIKTNDGRIATKETYEGAIRPILKSQVDQK